MLSSRSTLILGYVPDPHDPDGEASFGGAKSIVEAVRLTLQSVTASGTGEWVELSLGSSMQLLACTNRLVTETDRWAVSLVLATPQGSVRVYWQWRQWLLTGCDDV